MKRLFLPVALAAVLAAASVASPGAAQTRPLPQRQLSRGAVSTVRATPEPKTTHVVYGTIASLKGASLVVRTRSGRMQSVDATSALAAGTYSAPLFVGKVVAVGGSFDASHVLHAQTVTRMTRLDPTTGPDR